MLHIHIVLYYQLLRDTNQIVKKKKKFGKYLSNCVKANVTYLDSSF